MPDPNAMNIMVPFFAGSKGVNNRIKVIDLLRKNIHII